MDKCLRPQIFDTDVNSEEGPRKWLHWKRTLESFIRRIDGATDRDKLDLLINFIDTNVYSYIFVCTTYADALNKLECAYVKPVNDIYAKHRLNTRRQNKGESLENFLQRLKIVSNDYNFVDVTASQCKEAAIRDAFIVGLGSPYIRQRLLEDNELRLNYVFNKARSLHEAQKNAKSYEVRHAEKIATVSFGNTEIDQPPKENEKRGADFPALNIKVVSFVVVFGINVLIVQQTNVFVTNTIAWAISQKFVYQK